MNNTVNKVVGVVLLIGMMAGCAHKMAWFKSGATQGEFNKDRYACLQSSMEQAPVVQGRDTSIVGNGQNYGQNGDWGLYGSGKSVDINNGNREKLFAACMSARGYAWQRIPNQ